MDRQARVRELWDAWERGDFDMVGAAFAADARWRAVEDGPWNCESRARILEVMRENRERRGAPRGTVEDVIDRGERVIVAFRPDEDARDGWPLDEGIRYVVLSVGDDGLITEMKGCASRRDALEYAAG